MAESSSPPPERKTYQSWRSQQSSNWRMKDETPRPEQPPRTQQRSFDQRREAPSSSSVDATPGTRLYVGNLLYSAKSEDVEQLFADNGFRVAHISMSTDPFTGRNPSYCFVDLNSGEEAAGAMAALSGMEVLGRPVKINPGVKKHLVTGAAPTPRRDWGAMPRDGNANGNGASSRMIREFYVFPERRAVLTRPQLANTTPPPTATLAPPMHDPPPADSPHKATANGSTSVDSLRSKAKPPSTQRYTPSSAAST